MEQNPINISVSEAEKLAGALFLDIRNPFELEICRIEGSLHIPMKEIYNRLNEIPKDIPVIVFCHHGHRSLFITKELHKDGYSNALNMAGGIHAWAKEIDTQIATY